MPLVNLSWSFDAQIEPLVLQFADCNLLTLATRQQEVHPYIDGKGDIDGIKTPTLNGCI